MKALVDELTEALHTLFLLLLPGWRRRSRTVHDLHRWSMAVGLLQIATGSVLYVTGGLRSTGGFAEQSATAFFEESQTEGGVDFDERLAFYWSGALGFVSFLATPLAWFAIYLMADGTFRFAGYWAGEATGTVAAYPGFLLWELGTGEWRRRRRLRRFGDRVRDRVVWNPRADGDWLVEVESAHDKGWRAEEAIQVDDLLYELVETYDRSRQGKLRCCYRLRRWPETKLVHTVVAYQPPDGAWSRVPPVQRPPVAEPPATSA